MGTTLLSPPSFEPHTGCISLPQDPVGHVMKLNDFLGLGRSRELCAQIADACGFSKLKVANEEFKSNIFKPLWKEGSAGFYRKGSVEDQLVGLAGLFLH